MASIKGHNTSPERRVKTCLRRMHYRYRSNIKRIPGTPDIVLLDRKKLIFVHGCFWHGHKGCSRAARPVTNIAFWNKKLNGNMRRDKKVRRKLSRMGWSVLVIWQCETNNPERMQVKLTRFLNAE